MTSFTVPLNRQRKGQVQHSFDVKQHAPERRWLGHEGGLTRRRTTLTSCPVVEFPPPPPPPNDSGWPPSCSKARGKVKGVSDPSDAPPDCARRRRTSSTLFICVSLKRFGKRADEAPEYYVLSSNTCRMSCTLVECKATAKNKLLQFASVGRLWR